jgi:hypothetical protein
LLKLNDAAQSKVVIALGLSSHFENSGQMAQFVAANP